MPPWNTSLVNKRVPRNMCPLYDEPDAMEPKFHPLTNNRSFIQSPKNRIKQTIHPYDRGWSTHHKSINPNANAHTSWDNMDGFFEMDQLVYPYNDHQPDYTPQINLPYHNTKSSDTSPEMYQPYSPENNWCMHPQGNGGMYNVSSPDNDYFIHPGSAKSSGNTKATRWHPSTYNYKSHHQPSSGNPMANIACTPRGVETSESNTHYQVFDCSAPNNKEKNYAKIGKLYLESSLLQHNQKPGNSPMGVRIHRRGKRNNRKSSVYYRSRRAPRDTCSSSSAGSMRRGYDMPPTPQYSAEEEDEMIPPGFKSHTTFGGMSSIHPDSRSRFFSNTQTNDPTYSHQFPKTKSSQHYRSSSHPKAKESTYFRSSSLPKTRETQTDNNGISRRTQTAKASTSRVTKTFPSRQSFPTEDFDDPFFTDQDGQPTVGSPDRSSKNSRNSRRSLNGSLSRWSKAKSDECPNLFGDFNMFIPGLFVLGVAAGFILCQHIGKLQYSFYSQLISPYC